MRGMELTAEQDDLLSYFLSADVAADHFTQQKGEKDASSTLVDSATGEFSFAQPNQVGASPAINQQPVSSIGAVQMSFQVGDISATRPPEDEDTHSQTNSMGNGVDTDEKRQRRWV